MQLKRSAALLLFIIILAVSATIYSCRNNAAPPSAIATVQTDTTNVAEWVHLADSALSRADLQEAAKYTQKSATFLMDAGLYDSAYTELYDLAIDGNQYDSTETICPILDRYIDQAIKKPDADTVTGLLLFLKGYVFQTKGRFFEANEAYWRSMLLLPESFVEEWSRMLNNMVQNYNSIGDYQEAVRFSLRNLEFIKKNMHGQDSLMRTSRSFRSLGWSYYELHRTHDALYFFNEALKLSTEEDKSDILTFISRTHLDAGKIDTAFFFVRQALGILKDLNIDDGVVKVDAVLQLARCYFEAGELEEALRLFYKELPLAIEINGLSHPDVVKIMIYIGWLYERRQQPAEALSAFQEAINMFYGQKLSKNPFSNPTVPQLLTETWLVDAFFGKSRSLEALYNLKDPKGNLNIAAESAMLAVEVKGKLSGGFITDTAKMDITARYRSLYEMGLRQALALGDTVLAYKFAQHAKAAILREKIARDNAFAALPDSLTRKRQTLLLEINDYKKKIEQDSSFNQGLLALEAQLLLLENALREISPSFAALEKASAPLDIEFIRNNLPEDAAILDFFCGDSIIYTFSFCKKGLKVYQTVSNATYLDDVAALNVSVLNPISKQTETSFLSSARACYRHLLERPLREIGEQGPNVARLWIVPDGMLHFTPFDVMLSEDVKTFKGQKMPYVVRKYATGYAFTSRQFFQEHPSNQYLTPYAGWGIRYDSLALIQINQDKNKLFAMRGNYSPLPRAPEEVTAVRRLLGGSAWLDAEAGKSGFISHACKSRICHLAMHAIPDDHSPQSSVLVFSPEKDAKDVRQQYLSVSEITALPLKADLVVLSACNTAKGALMPGEGLASLGRAFQYAGARAVLMAQWNTEDNMAYTLIPAFFKHLKAGQNKDVALQHAKLAMLDNPSFSAFQAPLYWAGFIVSGDLQPIQDGSTSLWIWVLAILVGLPVIWYAGKRFKKRAG